MWSELFSQNGQGLEATTWKGISVATCECPFWSGTHCALVYSSRAVLQCASCSLPVLIRYDSNVFSSLSSKCSFTGCSLIDAGGGWSLFWEKGVQQTCRKHNWIPHSWHEMMQKRCQIIYSETCFRQCHLPVSPSTSTQFPLLLGTWARASSPETFWAVAFPPQRPCACLSHGVVWSRLELNRVMSGWGELSRQI